MNREICLDVLDVGHRIGRGWPNGLMFAIIYLWLFICKCKKLNIRWRRKAYKFNGAITHKICNLKCFQGRYK